MRGDVPGGGAFFIGTRAFSPRARGCSLSVNPPMIPDKVFPACAGMFLPSLCAISFKIGFPRVRGDVPYRHKLRN